MIKNYFKISFRSMKENKSYSFINILGLAVGMAACFLMLMWVRNELSFNQFHEHRNDLHRITIKVDDNYWRSSPWALNTHLKKDYPEVMRASWFYRANVSTRYQDKNFNERIALVSDEFFEMFTFPHVKGDESKSLTDVNSIVISRRTAVKYFGDENPMGRTINLDNQKDLVVTGVIENVPLNSDLQFDLATRPEVFIPKERMATWSMDCPSFVQLAPGADFKQVSEKISGMIKKYAPGYTMPVEVGLHPLKKMHLQNPDGSGPITYVYIFSAIALLVLLMACINFMNLSTARSSLREREIGVRKVVGAVRWELVKQFFSESILFSYLALVLSIFLVYLFLPGFNAITGTQLNLNFFIHPEMAIGFVLIALVTGLVSGMYPSLYLSSFNPVSMFRKSGGKGSRQNVLRRALIVFQFSAAIILMISVSVILKQMHFIKSKDLGFNRDNILSISMDDELMKNYESVKSELLKNSVITHVTRANSLPIRIANNNQVYWEGRRKEDAEMIRFVVVDYDYFETFGMKMAHGRGFSPNHPSDKDNYIINETALKMTGYKDPIGKMYATLKSPDESGEGVLVGVVKDFHGTSLRNDIQPTVFFLFKMLPRYRLFIRADFGNVSATVDKIKNTLLSFSPNFIFEFNFLDEQFDRMYRNERDLQKLIGYFTFLAIFISFLGLLGLAAFMAERKTREIAIRKVLGASSGGIVARLSKEIVLLVAVANLIGWPIGFYFMNNWIREFAFHTSIGWLIFPLAGLAALAIAVLTVSFQAIRAAGANPVDSLKYE